MILPLKEFLVKIMNFSEQEADKMIAENRISLTARTRFEDDPMSEPGVATIGEMYGTPRLDSVIDYHRTLSAICKSLGIPERIFRDPEDVLPDHVVGGSDEPQAKQT